MTCVTPVWNGVYLRPDPGRRAARRGGHRERSLL